MINATSSVLEARVIDLTAEQLLEAMKGIIEQGKAEIYEYIESRLNYTEDAQASVKKDADNAKPAYGIKGIAEVLHCSQAKAQRMKNEGLLEGGYIQIGKSIVVRDRARLIEIASHAKETKQEQRNARRGRRVNYSIIN